MVLEMVLGGEVAEPLEQEPLEQARALELVEAAVGMKRLGCFVVSPLPPPVRQGLQPCWWVWIWVAPVSA